MSNQNLVGGTALAALLGMGAAEQANGGAAGGEKERRAPSILWLNIGVEVKVPVTPENPEGTKFVSLPFGLALDDMKHLEAKGKNQEWHELVAAKNALLDKLRAAGSELPNTGAEVIIPSLRVQLTRKAEVAPAGASDPSRNPLLEGVIGQLG